MVRTLALAAVASLAFVGSAFAVCPSNSVGPSGPLVVGAHRDSSCANASFCYWRSQYDNALGTSSINIIGPGCSSEVTSSSSVTQNLSDDYVISGPAGPVSFQVFLHVVGTGSQSCRTIFIPGIGFVQSCSNTTTAASINDGSQSASVPATQNVNTTLVLNLTKTVGTHFLLNRSLAMIAPCSNTGNATSELSIVLPPGYTLTSCYGFSVSSPVPTLRASWGRVKTLYR